MVYAFEILNNCFQKTKDLFFPIRNEYWLKMGFVSLFSQNNSGGSSVGNGFGSFDKSDTENALKGMTLKQIVSQFNTQYIDFLSKYGYLIGITFFIFYILILFFTYLNSLFTFVFIDGLVKKEIKIRKSISENKTQGISLFFFRFYFGLINLFLILLIFSPIVYSFFTNRLTEFNVWLLIRIGLTFFIYLFFMSIFLFLVNDFIIPIMYMKKYTFGQAWNYFKKIASGKNLEIFFYWLLKILLNIAVAITSIILFIPLILILLLFILLGVYLLSKIIGGSIAALVITAIYASIIFLLFIYATAVVSVPIHSFIKIYSIEMVKKLEETEEKQNNKKETKNIKSQEQKNNIKQQRAK